MNVSEQIDAYLGALPEPKGSELRRLHEAIVDRFPGLVLSFLDGRDDSGRVVTNPNMGYGQQKLRYADGTTRDFYQVGLSANTSGISVFLMGLKDKSYLPQTYGARLGKASVTSYCIKFRKLGDIDESVLLTAIRDGIEKTSSTLVLERTLACTAETLWRFWTVPDLMRLWFGSDPEGTVRAAGADPRVDGHFSVTFANSDGTEHTCLGRYLVVEPFVRLAFTWFWRGRESQVEVVSLEFFDVEHGVRMRFTHRDIDPDTSHNYRAGWNSTFDKLERAVGPGETLS